MGYPEIVIPVKKQIHRSIQQDTELKTRSTQHVQVIFHKSVKPAQQKSFQHTVLDLLNTNKPKDKPEKGMSPFHTLTTYTKVK